MHHNLDQRPKARLLHVHFEPTNSCMLFAVMTTVSNCGRLSSSFSAIRLQESKNNIKA